MSKVKVAHGPVGIKDSPIIHNTFTTFEQDVEILAEWGQKGPNQGLNSRKWPVLAGINPPKCRRQGSLLEKVTKMGKDGTAVHRRLTDKPDRAQAGLYRALNLKPCLLGIKNTTIPKPR